MRVPLFVRWPGQLEAGHGRRADRRPRRSAADHRRALRRDEPKTLPLDGVSLVPLLTGQADDWPDRMIFARTAGWRTRGQLSRTGGPRPATLPGQTVRTQRWRAVNEGDGWQLYDMPRRSVQEQRRRGRTSRTVAAARPRPTIAGLPT